MRRRSLQIISAKGREPMLRCDGCGETVPISELKACTRCRGAYYHNVECQRRHWKVHKMTCRLQLRRSPGKGRGLFANHFDFASSQLIATWCPLVLPVLFVEQRHSHCVVCLRQRSSMRSLGDVPAYPVRVCRQCQVPNALQRETLAVQEVLKMCPQAKILPTALLVCRLVILGQQQHLIDDMQGHDTVVPQSEDAQHHRRALEFLVFHILRASRVAQPDPLVVGKLLNRILYNAFTITDNGFSVAVGVFEAPSYRINHSCVPNAQQQFVWDETGVKLRIRAVTAIPRDAEIFISYTDTPNDDERRKEELQESYRFTCDCPRCR